MAAAKLWFTLDAGQYKKKDTKEEPYYNSTGAGFCKVFENGLDVYETFIGKFPDVRIPFISCLFTSKLETRVQNT